MDKMRKIKPISFNTVKDADLLSWIEKVEKDKKINYAQYVKNLIKKDMESINIPQNNMDYIISEITNNIKKIINDKY